MLDSNIYNIFIKGYIKVRNMKEVWYLYKEMIVKGFGFIVSIYNVFIKGFLKRKKYVEVK